jgi:adenylosuccinate synthase
MTTTVVLGAQWGDEGKGKIVDLLAERMDLTVRFQGGANAGHTVYVDGRKIVLHQVPSGILHGSCFNLIANGCVVDAPALLEEIDRLATAGFAVNAERLLISNRAHLVTPLHRWVDLQSGTRVGTTGRGIGPCYADKTARLGLRLLDAQNQGWEERLHEQFERISAEARLWGWGQPPQLPEWLPGFRTAVLRLLPLAGDTAELIAKAHHEGARILLEGAQGTLLDLDHGTYPFVTSSATSIGGALTGCGVFLPLDVRLGVFKAYTTRVGNGPFPTEQNNAVGERLREVGQEYGATTGRPRRCGWLDLPMMRLACRINGFNRLVMTKLDCLSDFETIQVAESYDGAGNPVYKEFPGWMSSLTECRSRDELPAPCRAFLAAVEADLQVPIAGVSLGPDRRQIVLEASQWP